MAAKKNVPLVSVIIPVYNGADFIGESIDSALQQSYGNLEVIVVDDGSTDGTLAILNGYAAKDDRVRVISQVNGGVSKARNTAIAAARGEFIAPLDADDVWRPSKLDRQVRRMLAAGEDTGLVYSWWAWIDEDSLIVDRSPRWTIEGDKLETLMYVNFVGNASVPLFRRSFVDAVGGYRTHAMPGEPLICEDYDLALRVAANSKIAGVQDVLVGYRRRRGSRSTACNVMWRSQQAVLQSLRAMRPDLKPALFKACDNQFCMYVAGLAFMSGDTKAAIKWGLRAGLKLPLLVAPYALKMLLLPRRNKHPQYMRAGQKLDPALLPEPLMPYDRILSPKQLPGRLIWAVMKPVRDIGHRFMHSVLLSQLRTDGQKSRQSGKPRVLATACWHFPIYSQTFVSREVLALVNKGFEVRFLYAGLNPRTQLPDDLQPLWDNKRRILYADSTATRDFEHYKSRMPSKVKIMTQIIASASGMDEEEVLANTHFRHAFTFARFAEAWQPDYIHTYFFYEAAVFGLVASSLLGIPRGVSCYADHMVDDYDLKIIPAHMSTCDVVVATSARIKRELEGLVERPLPSAIVKPNGIDSTQFNPVERPSPGPGRVFHGIAVNRIHAKKGMTYLVEAIKLLRDRGVPLVMQVAGEYDDHDPQGPAYFEQLKKYIADNKLESSFHFLGRQTAPQVRQHLSDGDIFVAPFVELANGDKDGIPTALLEAMAAGCAIVATDAGSITEVFTNGVEGLMVPQCDAVALADAIEVMVADDALRTRLSKAAVERVRKEFDVSSCEAIFHERVRLAIAKRGAAVPVAATR